MITVTPRLYIATYRAGLLLCLLSISWLAFGSPPSNIPASVSDKVLHAGAFFVLGYLLDGALPNQSFWKLKFLLLLAYGFFIELVQSQLSYRDFSMLDLLADGAGALLYWVCHKPLWIVSEWFFSKKAHK